PATATRGAHGLLARAVKAVARLVVTTGSRLSLAAGMGGGPEGRPLMIDVRPTSILGLGATIVLLPEVSRAPPGIHCRKISRVSLARTGDLGGMYGSCLCVTTM